MVDDDRAMVATLCDILELRGWETVRAYDGAAAAELAEVHGVDVVLMDVRMPKVDGVSALREIKARRPGVR
ncbi:MAG: response regulator transcription factor, partial [Gemmatimonadaceae bacterium]